MKEKDVIDESFVKMEKLYDEMQNAYYNFMELPNRKRKVEFFRCYQEFNSIKNHFICLMRKTRV